MNIVIVESAAKAKTINKYLGKDYKVIPSFGHVRDLPAKDGSVQPDNDFAMEWTVESDSSKTVNEIARAVKGADRLILATDPDREGEAISWHLLQILQNKRALKGVDVERVAFNAVTKEAIMNAMAHPREHRIAHFVEQRAGKAQQTVSQKHCQRQHQDAVLLIQGVHNFL